MKHYILMPTDYIKSLQERGEKGRHKARCFMEYFLDIEQAVLDGKVDAGVLIHESILTYNDKLEVEAELWDIWQSLAGTELPLPLGGMCIRRSIPLNKAIDYEKTLIDAVKVANSNKLLLSIRCIFVRI